MEQHEFEQKIAENKKLLDGLDLPRPTIGENVWNYISRVEEMFKDVTLPEDYQGELFYWLDSPDLGNYLGDRFHMFCEEVICYLMFDSSSNGRF